MAQLQEQGHDVGHDYERGSPHLRHSSLRDQVTDRITSLVTEQMSRAGRCRVLEVGAGHGGFTEHLVASGAQITVTEMSRPSLDALQRRLGPDAGVRFVYDSDGEAILREDGRFDLVLCISVLHHVPDYLHFVSRLVDRIDPGGAFASFQDPLWYPRRSRMNRATYRAAYYSWRVAQPNRLGGLQTLVRRATRTLDPANPADMVEYHVVRDGVDEVALCALLSKGFASVDQWRYWSTQSRSLQATGERLRLESTFGAIARGRRHGCCHELREAGADEDLRQVGHILLLDRAAGQAIGLLQQREIRTILLKGAAIRGWLYDPHEVRPSSDVDLLVPADQFERATASLAELGYVHSLAGADPAEMGPRERDLVGPDNIWIDLHFGLLGIRLSPQACFERLWERTEDFELPDGRLVRILDVPARVMHLALHAAQNGPIDTKALADLARGLDRVGRPAWEEAAALAAALQATEAFAAGLRLLPEGEALAASLGLPTRMTVELALRVHSAPQDAIFFERLREARGVGKLALVARKLSPTTAFLRANAAEPLSRRQLLIARGRHPFTVARRLAPALVAWLRARQIARRSA